MYFLKEDKNKECKNLSICIDKNNVLGIDFYERDTALVALELIGKVLIKKEVKGNKDNNIKDKGINDIKDIKENCENNENKENNESIESIESKESKESSDSSDILSGVIIETEAYYGQDDPASHAFRGRTKRAEIMFGRAGIAYVYFCYGMYYLLNAVTEKIDTAGAVLIRSVLPLTGIKKMVENIRRFRHSVRGENYIKNYKNNKNKSSIVDKSCIDNFIFIDNFNYKNNPDNYFKKIINDNKISDNDDKKMLLRLTNGPGKLTMAYNITRKDNGLDLTNTNNNLNILFCPEIEEILKNNKNKLQILKSPRIGISAGKEKHLRYFLNDPSAFLNFLLFGDNILNEKLIQN